MNKELRYLIFAFLILGLLWFVADKWMKSEKQKDIIAGKQCSYLCSENNMTLEVIDFNKDFLCRDANNKVHYGYIDNENRCYLGGGR